MSLASNDAKQRVKDATDIVDLVGSYLQLRREGRGFKALCPWHDDSRPSLQINPERQSYKCWVCDLGGDVFSFVMQMEGVAFPEALNMLAERAGIRLDAEPGQRSGGGDEKRTLYDAMTWADQQYHACLSQAAEADPAREYLIGRGISKESISKFRLGFAPQQWDWLLTRARGTSFTPSVLENVGLAKRRQQGPGHYDAFRGRVIFPIYNAQGRAVGLGGRILPALATDDTAKYYNSPETQLFSKSKLLYGMNVARDAIRKTGMALVMEGYTDCVIAHQFGFHNAVAVLGTALGRQQIQLLRGLADRLQIVLVLDGDEAGRRRANEILELFVAENVDLRVMTLPDEADPCEFLLEHGAEAFQHQLDQTVDALSHAFRSAVTGVDLQRDVHRASQALEQLITTIAKAPRLRSDTMAEDRLREEKFLQRLAFDFRVPEEEVRNRMTLLRRKSVRTPTAGQKSPAGAVDAGNVQIDNLELEFLEVLLQFPAVASQLIGAVQPEEFGADVAREIVLKSGELLAAGETVDFARLLLEFDDPWIKNLLVKLDEGSRLKAAAELEVRIRDVLAGFQRRRNEPWRRAQTAVLKERRLKEDEELAILLQMQQQERARQGISEPMDG